MLYPTELLTRNCNDIYNTTYVRKCQQKIEICSCFKDKKTYEILLKKEMKTDIYYIWIKGKITKE